MYHSRVALNRRQVRFLVRFAVLLVAFYAVVLLKPVDRAVIVPYTAGIASVATSVINLLGEHVHRIGTVISGTGFAVDIKNGCNGVEATVFIAAAMIAFEAPLKTRIIGIILGAVTIQLLNLVRIVSLYWIGVHRKEWFETFHLAVWQSVIFAVAILVFLQWTRRVQQTDAARAR